MHACAGPLCCGQPAVCACMHWGMGGVRVRECWKRPATKCVLRARA